MPFNTRQINKRNAGDNGRKTHMPKKKKEPEEEEANYVTEEIGERSK